MKRAQNSDINLVTYFPNIVWQRKLRLLSNCKEQQKIQPRLRYQIRLGNGDISLWTKEVGEPAYICTPITAFGSLPPIENDGPTKMTTKRLRSVSPPNSQNKRQCNDADSSIEMDNNDTTVLNSAMDNLASVTNVSCADSNN